MSKSPIEIKPEGEWAEPIVLTVREAADLSRTSRSTIYEALQRGELVGKKLGRRTLILFDDLRAYLEGLPSFDQGDA